MTQATQVDHISRTTLFWILGTLIGLQVAINAFILANVTQAVTDLELRTNSQMSRLEDRIDINQTRIENVNNDIRTILVGIEQVKARLGIVEVTKQ